MHVNTAVNASLEGSNSDLLILSGTLQGVPFWVLFGRGSSGCFVSAELVAKGGMTVSPIEARPVLLGDDSPCTVDCVLPSAKLKIGRYRDKVTFQMHS